MADSEDSTVIISSHSRGSTTVADTIILQGENREQESGSDSEDTVRGID